MKKLKIGFSFIIAILAVGLTIAAQAGAFEAKKALASGPCYTPNFSIKSTCASSEFPLTTSVSCQDVKDLVDQPGLNEFGHIYLPLNSATAIPQADIALPENCPGGDFFCCAQIVLDTNPCTDQPNVLNGAKYRIDGVGAVFCKEEAN